MDLDGVVFVFGWFWGFLRWMSFILPVTGTTPAQELQDRFRSSRTGPGPPGQVQDLQELQGHLQEIQEQLQDYF